MHTKEKQIHNSLRNWELWIKRNFLPLLGFFALSHLPFCLPNSSVYVGSNDDALSRRHQEKFRSVWFCAT